MPDFICFMTGSRAPEDWRLLWRNEAKPKVLWGEAARSQLAENKSAIVTIIEDGSNNWIVNKFVTLLYTILPLPST